MAFFVNDKARVAGLSFVLFCLSLFLTAYSAKHPQVAQIGDRFFAEVLRPVQKLHHGGLSWANSIWDKYFALVDVQEENQRFKARLSTLEAENARLIEIQAENERLKKLLAISGEAKLTYTEATVIGYDPSAWVHAVTIDRGASDGITVGMAVVEGSGVVGQVVSVSAGTSRVLLMIDHASGIDAVLQESRVRGVVDGTGEDKCDLRYINENEEVSVGDKVVTSGMDGVFPKGLAIGVVTTVDRSPNGLFKSVRVTPSVNFSKLEDLLVVSGVKKE